MSRERHELKQVIVISLVLTQGVNQVSRMMTSVQKMEKWIMWGVAAVFIIVGLYYIVIVFGPMVGVV